MATSAAEQPQFAAARRVAAYRPETVGRDWNGITETFIAHIFSMFEEQPVKSYLACSAVTWLQTPVSRSKNSNGRMPPSAH